MYWVNSTELALYSKQYKVNIEQENKNDFLASLIIMEDKDGPNTFNFKPLNQK